MKLTWPVFSSGKTPRTVGSLLQLGLPEFGIDNVVAKVDTGAFSGALHATHIIESKDQDGKPQLTFNPMDEAERRMTVSSFHTRLVKSSNGSVARRYAIDTELYILGEHFPITITLSNRSDMKYQMLIGRRFLRAHGFLVDVSLNNK